MAVAKVTISQIFVNNQKTPIAISPIAVESEVSNGNTGTVNARTDIIYQGVINR